MLEAVEMNRHAPAMMGKGGNHKFKRACERQLADIWNSLFPKVTSSKASYDDMMAFRHRMEAKRK